MRPVLWIFNSNSRLSGSPLLTPGTSGGTTQAQQHRLVSPAPLESILVLGAFDQLSQILRPGHGHLQADQTRQNTWASTLQADGICACAAGA